VHDRVSFDINPTSRQILENLVAMGLFSKLLRAGARAHQAGCNGCIGMGQAPATDRISLRTVPRNFPGRSGTREDQVYLCSPETAAASALTGVITDPRALELDYPHFTEPEQLTINTELLLTPVEDRREVSLEKGPNIKPLPEFEPLPENLEGPVLLKVGDDISTDEIMPAGSTVLPWRSNIPEIAKWTFWQIDGSYFERAMQYQQQGSFVVGGENYGQGSSREHAALAPKYLGLKAVLAKSFARIHWHNLINFAILPLTFSNPNDYDHIAQDDQLCLPDIRTAITQGNSVKVQNKTRNEEYKLKHSLSGRQVEIILEGSLINLLRKSSP